MLSAISALDFSRRRSCQISVISNQPTTFLRGVTAKQAVLRLHRRGNRLYMFDITEILQLRRKLKSQSENCWNVGSNFRFGVIGTLIGLIRQIYTDFFLVNPNKNQRKSVASVQSVSHEISKRKLLLLKLITT